MGGSTPGTAGIPDVNILHIGNAAISTTIAQFAVNVVQWGGHGIQYNQNGIPLIDIGYYKGNACPAANVSGVPIVDLKYTLGTLSAGSAGYIGIDWSAINAPTTTVNLSGTTILNVTDMVTVQTIVTGIFTDGLSSDFSNVGTPGYWLKNLASGAIGVNVSQWAGSNVATPNVAGVPVIDVGYLRGTASAGTAGYVGLDWSAVHAPTSTVNLSSTTIGILTTYNGNTPQSGDAFARMGAPSGASMSADIAALPAKDATAVWTDLLAGSDFSTANSIGALVKTLSAIETDASSVSHDLRGAIRLLLAAVFNEISGATPGQSSTVNLKSLNGGKTRAVQAVDANGNNTSISGIDDT